MQKVFIIPLLLGLLTFSCEKTDISVVNLNNNIIKVIGHGGMGIAHNYPMNTFPSVMKAVSLGANGVEIDVQMTNDGVLVAYHDYDMSKRSTSSGQIYNQSWDEISGTTYLNPLYTDYALMRLDSLISGIPDHRDVIFFLDCKNFNPDTSDYYLNKFTDVLIELLDSFGLGEKVYIEFKRVDLIRTLREKRGDLKIFFYVDNFDTALKTALEYNLPGITMSINLISTEQVAMAHAKGVMVSVLNTHTRARNRQAIEMNVDFIQTDMLRYLIRLLRDSPHGNL